VRITLKDYGEHGAVTVFGEDAIDKLFACIDGGNDLPMELLPLPEGVVKRELTIEREPHFPKLRP